MSWKLLSTPWKIFATIKLPSKSEVPLLFPRKQVDTAAAAQIIPQYSPGGADMHPISKVVP